MKNIHVHDLNKVDCENKKYHLELSATGMVVAKCGWTQFPTVAGWVSNGGTESQRTTLESACNAVYQHLTAAICTSAIYAASAAESDKLSCNASEKEAIAALKNLITLLGKRVDAAGKARECMFVPDATSIKCLYVLCAGRKPLELCSPEVFKRKLVPFLLLVSQGQELSKAADLTAEEAKKLAERREASKNKVSKEELEKAHEANKKLSVEKEVLTSDNRMMRDILDKVEKYVRENEHLDRTLLLEMLKH